jgi:hypothetical protein
MQPYYGSRLDEESSVLSNRASGKGGGSNNSR